MSNKQTDGVEWMVSIPCAFVYPLMDILYRVVDCCGMTMSLASRMEFSHQCSVLVHIALPSTRSFFRPRSKNSDEYGMEGKSPAPSRPSDSHDAVGKLDRAEQKAVHLMGGQDVQIEERKETAHSILQTKPREYSGAQDHVRCICTQASRDRHWRVCDTA
jgi:hypothetical protein